MSGELVEKYEQGEQQRQRRKEFLGLTPADEQALAHLKEQFSLVAPQLAERFYQHLLAAPETASFLADPQLLARLKQSQMQYFRELVSGEYGAAYFERRLRVGETHQRIGLEPNWYLGAYNLYIQICFPEFATGLGDSFPPELAALVKVILLDIGLALETYFSEATEQLRGRNEQLERALQMYFQTEVKAQQYAKLAGHEIRGTLNAVAN